MLVTRLLRRERAEGPGGFSAERYCEGHPSQLAFVSSRAKRRTGVCSRRAGKTAGDAGVLLDAPLRKPGSVALYLTKTRLMAKGILWGTLKQAAADAGIQCVPNESELRLHLPNGSQVWLGGVHTSEEVSKWVGPAYSVVVIDEAQTLPRLLPKLIDEVVTPALADYDGQLVLTGTPGPVPTGYYYECTQSAHWEHHHWTIFDNPHIQRKSGRPPMEMLQEELDRRGITLEDPIIQREWFGKWCFDPNALVFRYSEALNDYSALPTPKRGEWMHVVCGDIGWDDADALAVLSWHEHLPHLWLTHEDVMPKQTITQLGDKLKALDAKYNPRSIVLDFGGLGKKIAEEVRARWGLNVKAADKPRKNEHIELLNDALRTGLFKAKRESRFAQDAMLVEWDRSDPEKPVISDRFHSDICDAVLYGYTECYQWLSEPAPAQRPKPGSQEAIAAYYAKAQREVEEQAEREAERLERKRKGEDDGEWERDSYPWG